MNCCLCSCQLSWWVLRKFDSVFFTVICTGDNQYWSVSIVDLSSMAKQMLNIKIILREVLKQLQKLDWLWRISYFNFFSSGYSLLTSITIPTFLQNELFDQQFQIWKKIIASYKVYVKLFSPFPQRNVFFQRNGSVLKTWETVDESNTEGMQENQMREKQSSVTKIIKST